MIIQKVDSVAVGALGTKEGDLPRPPGDDDLRLGRGRPAAPRNRVAGLADPGRNPTRRQGRPPDGDYGRIAGGIFAFSAQRRPSATPLGDKCLIRPGIPAQLRRLAAIGSSSSFPSLAPSSTAATSASRSVRSLANAHESGPRRSSAIKPSTTRFDGSRFPELLPGEIQRHHCSGGSPRRSLRDEN